MAATRLQRNFEEIKERLGIIPPQRSGVAGELADAFRLRMAGVRRGYGQTLEEMGFTTAGVDTRLDAEGFIQENQQLQPTADYSPTSLRPADVARTVGDVVGSSVGIAGASIAGTVAGGPLLGAGMGATVAFSQRYGEKVQEYRAELPEDNKQMAEPLAFGVSAAMGVVESFFGPEAAAAKAIATAFGKEALEQVGKKLAAKGFTNFGLEMLKTSGPEVAEEWIEPFLDVAAQKAGGAKDVKMPTWAELRDAGAAAALGSLVLGFLPVAANVTMEKRAATREAAGQGAAGADPAKAGAVVVQLPDGMGSARKEGEVWVLQAKGGKETTVPANSPDPKIQALYQNLEGLAAKLPKSEAAPGAAAPGKAPAKAPWQEVAPEVRAEMDGLVEGINKKREEAGLEALPSGGLRAVAAGTDEQKAAEKLLGESLGLKVIWVQNQDPNVSLFDGAHVTGRTVFINEKEAAGKPYLKVAMHEFGHALQEERPEDFGVFLGVLKEHALETKSKYAERLEALTKERIAFTAQEGGELSQSSWDEFGADVLADFGADPKFWEALRTKDQSLAERVARMFLDWIAKVTAKLTKTEAVQFLDQSKLGEVREYAAALVSAHAEKVAAEEAAKPKPPAAVPPAAAAPNVAAPAAGSAAPGAIPAAAAPGNPGPAPAGSPAPVPVAGSGGAKVAFDRNSAEELQFPSQLGETQGKTNERIDSLIPFNIQGNKSALLTKSIGKMVEMAARVAKRTIDAFGGSGTYTHYLGETGNRHQGDILNEYESLRAIAHRQIRDNPERVMAESKRILGILVKMAEESKVQEGQLFPGSPNAKKLSADLREFLRGELEKHMKPGQTKESTRKVTVEMVESPELAGVYLVAQNHSFRYLPFQAEVGTKGFSVPGFNFVAKIEGKVKFFSRNNAEGKVARILPAGKRLQGVDVRQGDGWKLIREEAGAGDFVPVDTSYLNSGGEETSNYGIETQEDAIPEVYMRKVQENLLPAWDRGAMLLITNNWDDRVAGYLQSLGFRVFKASRKKGVSNDVLELVASNFDPASGAVDRRREALAAQPARGADQADGLPGGQAAGPAGLRGAAEGSAGAGGEVPAVRGVPGDGGRGVEEGLEGARSSLLQTVQARQEKMRKAREGFEFYRDLRERKAQEAEEERQAKVREERYRAEEERLAKEREEAFQSLRQQWRERAGVGRGKNLKMVHKAMRDTIDRKIDALGLTGKTLEEKIDQLARYESDRGAKQPRFSISAKPATAMDRAYLKAVENGSLAAAQGLVNAAAKRAGYTIGPVYHGATEDFNEFDPAKWQRTDAGTMGAGFYFTTDQADLEDLPVVKKVFLKIKNIEEMSPFANDGSDYQGGRDLTAGVRMGGTDGLVSTDGSWYVVYDPSQIKSAEAVVKDDAGKVIPLTKRFQASKPDIRFSMSKEERDDVYLEAVKRNDLGVAQQLVDEAAAKAGYEVVPLYRGQGGRRNSGYAGFMFTTSKERAKSYAEGADPVVLKVYLRIPKRPMPGKENAVASNGLNSAESIKENLEWLAADPDGEFGGLGGDMYVLDGRGGDNKVKIPFRDEDVKSAEPVTRDDAGDVIPLSERFNEKSPDVRFSVANPAERMEQIQKEHGISTRRLAEWTQMYGTFDEWNDQRMNTPGRAIQRAINPKRNYRLALVPVGDITPSQTGEDYDNDSSRYTAKRLTSGSVFEDRRLDMAPIKIDAQKKIIDGNHRHAAAVFNGDRDIAAMVDTGNGAGTVTNLREFYDALKAGETDSIRFSLSPTPADEKYLAAVEKGDLEAAQRLVDDEAKKAGYTVLAFKGMMLKDWRTGNTINTIKSVNGDWAGFFSSDKAVAERFRAVFATMGDARTLSVYLDMAGAVVVDAKGGKAREFQFDNVNPSNRRNDMLDLIGRSENGVIVENTEDEKTVYIPKRPSQIKSAEAVTRDDAGKVIPLSQRFRETSPDIRFSVSSGQDAEYSAAVEKGDLEAAQRLVEQTAREAGFGITAYHGSNQGKAVNYFLAGKGGFRYFADEQYARSYAGKEGKLIKVFLSTRKPLNLRAGQSLKDYSAGAAAEFFRARGLAVDGVAFKDLAPLRSQVQAEGFKEALLAAGYDSITLSESGDDITRLIPFPSQIKSAEAVVKDNGGRVIPLSERFNSERPDIRFSASGDRGAVFGLSERVAQLSPVEVKALVDYALRNTEERPRSDLANPGENAGARAVVDATDKLRNDLGMPEKQTVEGWQAKATERFRESGAAALWRQLQEGELDLENPVNTLIAKRLLEEYGTEAVRTMDADKLKAAMLAVNRYRQARSEIARAMRAGFDPVKTPLERVRGIINGAFLDPGKALENAAAMTPAELAGKVQELARQLEKVKQQLKEKGVDLDNLKDEDVADPKKLADILGAIQEAKGSKFDMIYEYWINWGLLSMPTTHAANFLGNTVYALDELVVQRLAEATINLAAGKSGAASFGEFRWMLQALKQNWGRALKNGMLAWQTEESITGRDKFEMDYHRSTPGKAGKVVRAPTRLLRAADEIAKSILVPVEAAARAYRMANGEGLKGEALERRIHDLVGNPDSDAQVWARARSLELTFQQKPGTFAVMLLQLRSTPGVGSVVKFLLPFVSTPANIIRTTLRKSPLGLMHFLANAGAAALGKGKYAGNADLVIRHAAEQVLAFGVLGSLYALTGDDEEEPWITGSRPSRFQAGKNQFMQKNLPATSIRIGDRWFSYNRVEPFAGALAMMVDGLQGVRDAENGKDGDQILKDLFNSAVQNIRDKTFLQTVGDVIRAAEEPKTAGNMVSSFLASWVPNAVRGTLKAFDDTVRDQRNYGRGAEYWQNQLTDKVLASAGLYRPVPKVDHWGEEIRKAEGLGPVGDFLWRVVMPIYTSQPEGMAPAEQLIWRWNQANPNEQYWPELPAWWIRQDGETRYLSAEEHLEYAKLAGRYAKEMTDRYIQSGLNTNTPGKADIRRVEAIFSKARERARRQLGVVK